METAPQNRHISNQIKLFDTAQETGWFHMPEYLDQGAVDLIMDNIETLKSKPSQFENCMYFFGTDHSDMRRLTRIERMWESLPSLEATRLDKRIKADAKAFLGGERCMPFQR